MIRTKFYLPCIVLSLVFSCSNSEQKDNYPKNNPDKKLKTAKSDKQNNSTDPKQNKKVEPKKQSDSEKSTAKKVEPKKQKEEKSIWEKPVATELPSEYKNMLKGLKGEKLKKIKRVDDQHYYISNETRYDLWYPHIKDMGGAYVGVGPDQNYSLASIAKAKLVILMDYDYEVLSTHRLYMLFFREAEKPEDILEFFKRKHVKRFKKLAQKHYNAREARWVSAIHRGAGNFIRKHHRSRSRRKKQKGGRYWLTDPKIFAYWKKLVENDRIFLVPGDLRTGKALVEIGNLLKKLKLELNLLYLSNAEEFWSYTKEFRKSINNLPFDDQGLVLRTVVIGKKYAIGWKFHYALQAGKDFVKWMQTPGSFSSKTIARKHRIPIDGKPYLSRFPAPPSSKKQ